MKGRTCKCGYSMKATALTEGNAQITVWHCRWCLNEEQETAQSSPPNIPTEIPHTPADSAALLRGYVRVDQVIQGPKGGKIYRRMW